MSLRRIGSRSVVVGLGVVASLAFTAAPSWAANGNSANAALCEPGGYPGSLLAQDGSAFTNAGQCTSYGAQGGLIAGVNAVVEPPERFAFEVKYSGFGLKPNSAASLGPRYGSGGFEVAHSVAVGEKGEFSFQIAFGCVGAAGAKIRAVAVEATTKAGSRFLREFPPPPEGPPPNGC